MTRDGAQTSRWIGDPLGEVVGLDRPVAEALRQRRQLGRLREVAREEVHDGALTGQRGLVVRGEAVPQERCLHLGVVLERDRGARVRVGQDLVEQIEPVAPDVELEEPAIPLQPRPGDGPVAVLPDADRPLVLPPLVLEAAPR